MFFNKIIHGTQYYRAPTPLPNEWETDISRFEDFRIDAFQIRINWRQNERTEGVYDFSDVDRLMDLAEKYNRKVVMKFLLECAPQYVFDKYGGTRIGPKGEQLRGGSHGAFYTGGWLPCFTNPKVMESALKFVGKVAERYNGRKNLILWNVWNEIRNRPIEECFCPCCRKAFGDYLKDKFKTIEKLNEFYGVSEESFDTIALPSMPHGYWDIYEFKKFKGSTGLYNNAHAIYNEIRKYDSVHPIMCHVGCTSAFQGSLVDVSDDFTISKAVDFWGTSIPMTTQMGKHEDRLDFQMLNDFLYSVDRNYFIHEIYPGLGRFLEYDYDNKFDMTFKEYSAISSGAKGVMYWQFRSERVGHENDTAGLMRMDGSPREVSESVTEFGEDLRKYSELVASAEVMKADICIVFDFDSMLMSEIEDSCGTDYRFDLYNPLYYYRFAHNGMYRLLREKNLRVDYVGTRDIERINDYKVVYIPYYTMITEKVAGVINKYVSNGGMVIADEGFGMRQQNTWMQPYDIQCKPLIDGRMLERRRGSKKVVIGGEACDALPFYTEYNLKGVETVLEFEDGKTAVYGIKYGKGVFYQCAFSLGYSYMFAKNFLLGKIFDKLTEGIDLGGYDYADVSGDVYEKRLFSGDKEIIFLFNNNKEERIINIKENILQVYAYGVKEDNKVIIPPLSVATVIVEK